MNKSLSPSTVCAGTLDIRKFPPVQRARSASVADVAAAHVAAARALMAGAALEPVYNLGSGSGTSVGEIMNAVATVTGIAFEPEIKPRRAGDPSRIVADGKLAARDLGWEQRHTVESMVATAWSAHSAHAK